MGPRPEIVVALDWTEFDADNQSTVALYLVTKHGRATPLLWKTVVKSEPKGWRNEHEDVLLERLRQVLPEGVKVTVLADRSFGDQALYLPMSGGQGSPRASSIVQGCRRRRQTNLTQGERQ